MGIGILIIVVGSLIYKGKDRLRKQINIYKEKLFKVERLNR
jgi:hypothetical protein